MTIAEMHNIFKIGMDKVDSLSSPNFLPEEIDVLLNNAQDQLVSQRAFGNNPKREGLEETQKRLDDLKNIITNYSTGTFTNTVDNKTNGVFVDLPSNYRHAIQEEAVISYNDCTGTAATNEVEIVPISHDRYNRIIKDPFNKPDTEVVYRLGFGVNAGTERFELISDSAVTVSTYKLRYIREPQEMRYGTVYQTPTTDIDCELSDYLHKEIIALAVKNALEDIESQRYQTSKIELRDIE